MYNVRCTTKCIKAIFSVLESGHYIRLYGLTDYKLGRLGWNLYKVNPENLLLAHRNGEIVLMADVENSEPVLIADTFEKMGGIVGLSELIDGALFYKIVQNTLTLRNIIYRDMLDLYEKYISQDNTRDVGFCSLLLKVSDAYGKVIFIEDLPELFKRRPFDIGGGGYWFPTTSQDGINKRLNILREAIFETQYNTFL